jgi:aconitate hydratase A / 2-methylisocitrate dehydratase
MKSTDGLLDELSTSQGRLQYVSLRAASDSGLVDLDRVPITLRILVEMQLRELLRPAIRREEALRAVRSVVAGGPEILIRPVRVLCQDHSGLPVLADLASIRSRLAATGEDPTLVQPSVPVDLVVDHSVEVRAAARRDALQINIAHEYAQNGERYAFLRWAQAHFRGLRVVPPGQGIVHQVHLEHLASAVATQPAAAPGGLPLARPDTVLGTDSHTPMINGLGVLGWGVGGIEATAALLGLPVPMVPPTVLGVRLTGELGPAVAAMDAALALTETLRRHGVVGRLLEFHGQGVGSLAVPDRATLANMCPEYGATTGLFPVDRRTLDYLRLTRGDTGSVELVERYCKEQGLFLDPGVEPRFAEVVEFDLSTVQPSVAGPRRPQDRVPLSGTSRSFAAVVPTPRTSPAGPPAVGAGTDDEGDAPSGLDHGSVVIAAITSCTNTSNARAMCTAGLLARNAVRRGLRPRPWVKTSMAPGSRVVTRYLDSAGLLKPLSRLGFDVVGYGCTTCIGNSGPLDPVVTDAVRRRGLAVAAVLSGNRNFEGRIHPAIQGAYLASPALVVAWALAGTVRTDLTVDPLGYDLAGHPVRLADLWPRPDEVEAVMSETVTPSLFADEYERIGDGDASWRELPVPAGDVYPWDAASTYLVEPPFADGEEQPRAGLADLAGARVLVMVGDSTTTDHISPAGPIPADSEAARWLRGRGVADRDLGSYGGRRGNHEVLVRGTFANPRLRNWLVPDRPGGWTVHLPSGTEQPVHAAAARYRAEDVPLLVLAGSDYGMGSSRDWAAKGPRLLGVRAVLARSFERIHRSNLVAMGIVPLQFMPGEHAGSLGLTGREQYDLAGLADLGPGGTVTVTTRGDSATRSFPVRARVDSATELSWVRSGGVLPLGLAGLRRRNSAPHA